MQVIEMFAEKNCHLIRELIRSIINSKSDAIFAIDKKIGWFAALKLH
jgi:hypothetical protein